MPKRQRTAPDQPIKRKRFRQAPNPTHSKTELNDNTHPSTVNGKKTQAADIQQAMSSSHNSNNSTTSPSIDDPSPYLFSRLVDNITQHIFIRRKQRLEATLNNRVFTHLNTRSAANNSRSKPRPSAVSMNPSRPTSHSKSHHNPAPHSNALADLNYYLDGPSTAAKHSTTRRSPTTSPSSSQNPSHSLNIASSDASNCNAHPHPHSPSSRPRSRSKDVSGCPLLSSKSRDKDSRTFRRKRPLPDSDSCDIEPQDSLKTLPPKPRISPVTSSPSGSDRSTKSRFSKRPRSSSPVAPPPHLRSDIKPSAKRTSAPSNQLSVPVKAVAPDLCAQTPPSRPVELEQSPESCYGDVFARVTPPPPEGKETQPDSEKHFAVSEKESDHTCTSARTAGYRRKDWQSNSPPDLTRYHRQHDHVKFSSRDNRLQHRKFRKSISQIDPNHNFLNADLLKQRKRDVQFRKSRIHGMGLFARENIEAGEFVLEYIGEVVRGQIADLREERYTRRGMGDSYLFRLNNDFVVDATHRGGIARFINHSCDPNLVAKIISVRGQSRIVFYSKRPIRGDEELTYDYKFDYEDEDKKIDCHCEASMCRRFLN